MPVISAEMQAVYRRGLEMGNDPRAFSVLGDCQSLPEVFMGVFDSDPAVLAALPGPLRETAAHFAGSFDRYSPTVKDGTTEARCCGPSGTTTARAPAAWVKPRWTASCASTGRASSLSTLARTGKRATTAT
jgi:hypothetical protein